MAISVTKLLDLILVIAAAVVILGFISAIIFSVTGEAFACRLSVSIASFQLSDTLNCRIAEISMPKRVIEKEEAHRFIAEQMLECHSIYNVDAGKPLKNQNWIGGASTLPRALLGLPPDGRVLNTELTFSERLPGILGGEGSRQYCSICAIITLPETAAIEGFRDELAAEYYRGTAFVDRLYKKTDTDSRLFDHYYVKNSDAFLPLGESARVVILYTEGRVDGKDVVGIVALNLTALHTALYSSDRKENLCQGYLS